MGAVKAKMMAFHPDYEVTEAKEKIVSWEKNIRLKSPSLSMRRGQNRVAEGKNWMLTDFYKLSQGNLLIRPLIKICSIQFLPKKGKSPSRIATPWFQSGYWKGKRLRKVRTS